MFGGVHRVAHEADARSARAYLVGRALRLDAVRVLEGRERPVDVLDADRDVPVRRPQLVRAPVVVVGQLEDVLRVAERDEVVGRSRSPSRTMSMSREKRKPRAS
jgi:hypothetical protein